MLSEENLVSPEVNLRIRQRKTNQGIQKKINGMDTNSPYRLDRALKAKFIF